MFVWKICVFVGDVVFLVVDVLLGTKLSSFSKSK